jgi:hypothetical protein
MSEQAPKPPVQYHGRVVALTLLIFAAGIVPVEALAGRALTARTAYQILGASAFVLAVMYFKWWREGRLGRRR